MSNEQINVEKVNDVYIRLSCSDSGILQEIHEYFSFDVPSARYTPKFKSGQWDGKIRLFNVRSRTLYLGLFDTLKKFAESRSYTISQSSPVESSDIVTSQFIDHIPLHAAGSEIKPKDYQIEGITHALSKRRAVLLSPTGSGKSLIIYLLARWYMQHDVNKKILVIVPSINLVKQMNSDFLDYALKDSSFNEGDILTIHGGTEKNKDCSIYISTWQSLKDLPATYYKQFGMVIGDEVHGFKATCLCSIMEKCTDVAYRIGLTGTLDATEVNPLILTGLFGSVYRVAHTHELIDRGDLADISITMLHMKYSGELRKIISKIEYQEEVDYIVTHEKRNRFIAKLALAQEKNTLVLFNFVEKHGIPLYELIKSIAVKIGQPDRKIFLIHGGVDADDREMIRKITESENDAIIIASSGTMSVGTNIRNLHVIIFTSPMKSIIRVLQSVGRGLRKHGEDKVLKLFDIVDDFTWKAKKNFGYLHGIDRMKIYKKEKFPMKIVPVDI